MKWTDKRNAHLPREKAGEDVGGQPPEAGQIPVREGLDLILTIRLIIAALLFAGSLLIRLPGAWNTVLIVVSALIAGYDMLIGAGTSVLRGRFFDDRLLMSVAAVVAFIIGLAWEGAAVMVLYQFSRLLRSFIAGEARCRALDSLGTLPEEVAVIRGGQEYVVGVHNVSVGETVVIRPGERIALDCVVSEGNSALDLSDLTGESESRGVGPEDLLPAGAVNLSGTLRAEVCTAADASIPARMLEMIRSGAAGKWRSEQQLDRFIAALTPALLILAVLTAVLIPLFTEIRFAESIHRALAVWSLSCPCGLLLAAPVAYLAGRAGMAKKAVLFRDAQAVDAAAAAGTVVFDQTGTLTAGKFRVSAVKSDRMDARTFLKIAAHAESYSEHPIARAIIEASEDPIYIELIDSFSEQPGRGVTVRVDGVEIAIGAAEFLRSLGVEIPEEDLLSGTAVYMGVGGIYGGRITFGDVLREDAVPAVRELEEDCLCQVVMLSGDSEEEAGRRAEKLGLGLYYAGCRPEDKAEHLRALRAQVTGKRSLLLVDNGGSSAVPLRAEADMAVSMGCLDAGGSDQTADAILLDGKPSGTARLIRAARCIRSIVWQSLAIVAVVKLAALVLALLGFADMWMAILADMIAAVLVVCSSMRALNLQPRAGAKPFQLPFGRQKPRTAAESDDGEDRTA